MNEIPQNKNAIDIDGTLNAEIKRVCFLEGGYPDAWPRHAACPCCGGGPLVPRFSKQGISHSGCRMCEFYCVDPYPPEEIVRKLYAGAYYTQCRELFEAPRIRRGEGITPFTAPQDLIESMIDRAVGGRPTGRWLDVGGGIGTVADMIRRRNSGWSVTLNEFNPRSLELARELYNLDTTADTCQQLAASGSRFDVISAVSVLEHIPDPVSFMRSYADLLNPSGVMVLLVPQFTALNAAVSKAAAPVVVPPFHVSLFRESNLRIAAERAGVFVRLEITQSGSAAFSLLHHYDFSGYWDTTIPTASQPAPQGFMLRPYPHEMSIGLNALDVADKVMGDRFAQEDGRQYLAVYAFR